MHFRDNLHKPILAEGIAIELNLGYTNFRQIIKKYTGISPIQYHLQLRIKQAESYLLLSDMYIKEIAMELGFPSVFYFNNVFKQKTGFTPGEIRNLHNRK